MEKTGAETQKDMCCTMPETVGHHMLNDAQLVPRCAMSPSEIPTFIQRAVMLFGMEYTFG